MAPLAGADETLAAVLPWPNRGAVLVPGDGPQSLGAGPVLRFLR